MIHNILDMDNIYVYMLFLIGFIFIGQVLNKILFKKVFTNIKNISTKCNNCKNKAWCWSCDECQSKPLSCFVCDENITYRERHNHMSKHYNDPDQYLACKKCNVNKHISHYRFKEV